MKQHAIIALALVASLITVPAVATSPNSDIVETAITAGSFDTLVAALQAAGLVEALQADGPYTVFAPTDEAFAKLPAGTVENLLKPENIDSLKSVLTYHVVSGEVMSSAVTDGLSAPSLQGQNLTFNVADGKVMIGDAQVITADVSASNGVIHVIDTVLLPN